MAPKKTAPKTEETPMVSMTVFNALLARVEVLEAEKTKLVNDVSVLKKIPASLVVQETAMNRNTERIDSIAECIKNMPEPKPKKILGLF
tara:strand:- start:462 stop:728 length:267 start_codon:yes stop_codon:yes gene_type:complete